MTEITIPSSVKSIGEYAFSVEVSQQGTVGVPNVYKYESNLQNVTFEEPSSLETIGTKAFQGQKNLHSLELPSGITTINDHAFEDAVSLQTLSIPSNVISIEEGAFSRAESLTTINFSEGLETIGKKAFAYTYSLENLFIPNSVTTIGEGSFVNATSLTNLVLGQGLTTIGNEAFNNTPSLSSLTIGPNLTSIGSNAFKSAPITELTIDSESTPETLQKIANFFKKRTNPASVTTINCLGAERSVCDALMKPYWDITSMAGKSIPRSKDQGLSDHGDEDMDVVEDNVLHCGEGYLEKNGGCVTSCGARYRQIENWCNRIQYTPAEAAKVLRDDNTNEVTITFKK